MDNNIDVAKIMVEITRQAEIKYGKSVSLKMKTKDLLRRIKRWIRRLM